MWFYTTSSMKKNHKNILLIVGTLLVISVSYAVFSIISYNRAEEEAVIQRIKDQHTYSSKQDMEELLQTSPDDSDYVMEIYVGDGGSYQWHTQKLFIIRYKPVYTMLKENKVGFRVLMGDTKRAESSRDASFAKDAAELKKINNTPPLEYKIYTKNGTLIFHTRGSIPTKDAVAILSHAFTTAQKLKEGEQPKIKYYDYVKINEDRLKAARAKIEAQAKAMRDRRLIGVQPTAVKETTQNLQKQNKKSAHNTDLEKTGSERTSKRQSCKKMRNTLFNEQALGTTLDKQDPVQTQNKKSTLY